MKNRLCAWLAACLLPLSCMAAGSIEVSEAWARATAPGQEVGAAYMELRSSQEASLTAVTSPAAGSIEIHNMTMNHGVMEMRMLQTLPLPTGHAVKLEPGGMHLMLLDLKKPLKAGDQITLTLKIKDKNGKIKSQSIHIPVHSTKD